MIQILKIPKKKKDIYFFKSLLVLSILIITISALCMIYFHYKSRAQAKASELILNSYTISKLYSDSVLTYTEPSSPYIIGTIYIPKIFLELPIISEMSDELLAISACRFYGPLPNSIRKYLYCWA